MQLSLVVVQSKHSVVEAEHQFVCFLLYQEQWNSIQTISRTMEWGRVVLTDDAVEHLPVGGIKNPIRETRGEDKRSCKPVMIEHLEKNDQN